jgi:hypothetical protein
MLQEKRRNMRRSTVLMWTCAGILGAGRVRAEPRKLGIVGGRRLLYWIRVNSGAGSLCVQANS